MIDFGNKIAEWAVTLICDHPVLIGWFIAVFVLATLIVNGIKWTWPLYAEMPRGARFFLGLFMPLALNFYHLTSKLGVQEPQGPPTTTTTTTTTTVTPNPPPLDPRAQEPIQK